MRLAALAVLVLAATGSAWAGVQGNQRVPLDRNHIVLSGALRASWTGTEGDGSGCGLKRRTLGFMSGPMNSGRGPAVARVIFDLRRFHGPGGYDATQPRVEYGNTPLRIVTARNGASGAGAAWPARSGTVDVRVAYYKGKRLRAASGTMNAFVAYKGRAVRVRGTWRCSEIVYG
jgi:hypothetical protein